MMFSWECVAVTYMIRKTVAVSCVGSDFIPNWALYLARPQTQEYRAVSIDT